MIESVTAFNCINFVFGVSCEGFPSVLLVWCFNKLENLHCYWSFVRSNYLGLHRLKKGEKVWQQRLFYLMIGTNLLTYGGAFITLVLISTTKMADNANLIDTM